MINEAGDYRPVEAQLTVAAARATELADVRPGERLLDVCCGTGNAAAAGFTAGAIVTGIDLDPGQVDAAHQQVPAGTFLVADAMSLLFADDSFDVVVSTFGVSFLPGAPAADELLRVVRGGGRIVITSWGPAGSLLSAGGILGRAVAQAQGHPAFASSVIAWHDRATVRELFAPHRSQFSDEQIVFTAVSGHAVAQQYYERHPQWLKARQIVGETAYRQLQQRAARHFNEINEHASAWQATDRYLASVVTVDSDQ